MSTEYAGYPTVARRFWRRYSSAFIGMGAAYAFTGALAGIVVLVAVPDLAWLIVVSWASYTAHSVGLVMRDIRTGEFDPNQTTLESRKEQIAAIVMFGVMVTTVLTLTMVAVYVAATFTPAPLVVLAAIAAYYPVAELVAMRNIWYSPAGLMMVAVGHLMGVVVDFHQSAYDTLPVIGKRRRPQP